MKKHVFLIILAFGVLCMGCGCSPTINEWSSRGHEGIVNEKHNITQWYEMCVEQNQREQLAAISAVYADLTLVKAGSLKTKDGKPVVLTDEWLAASQKMLVTTLAAIAEKRKALDQMYETNMKNIGQLDEAFSNIQRLNRVYAGSQETLAMQVSKLAATIESMKDKK